MGAYGDQGRLSSKPPGPTAPLLRSCISAGWTCVQDHAHLLEYRKQLLQERGGAIWEEVWDYLGRVVGVRRSWVREISFKQSAFLFTNIFSR